MRALFVLLPAESKRLIAKAVAAMEEVKKAKKSGKMIIGHGSTNVYVAEEILGREKFNELIDRDAFLSGVIQSGTLCTIPGAEKPPILFINRGVVEPPTPTMAGMLLDFGRDSVFIKGANAVDPDGNASVMTAHPEGGTIGWSLSPILTRGIPLIVPVGLEKLVPSAMTSVEKCGHLNLDYCQGLRVGMLPLVGAKVITEIQALKMLTGAEAFHVASGGNSGSEGSVILIAEGEADRVEKAIELVESIKGEPHIKPRKSKCSECYLISPASPDSERVKGKVPAANCPYYHKKDEDLPPYLW